MNEEFDFLVEGWLHSLMEFRPQAATAIGLHQYDKKMPSGTKESLLKFIETRSVYLKKFQSIKEPLSPDRQIDCKLLISTLKYNLFKEREIRQWEKDPDLLQIISPTLLPLFSREFAPFENRLESITARLSKCPQFIEEFKSRIANPVGLWVIMAKEACNSLPLFFQVISHTAKEKGLDTTELDEASAKTADALSEYVGWLDTLPCEEEPFLGRELFEKLLKMREIGFRADEILKLGEDYLKKEKAHLKNLASKVDPSLSGEQVRARIRQDHPSTFEAVLNEYKKAITKMRALVCEKGFATLPEGEHLTVQETPAFLRHIMPVGFYILPGVFEKDQTGTFFITPVEGEALAEHNYTAILNIAVHETYPGHHLQAVWSNKNPSLARMLSFAPEFGEGWAHYCEERIHDYGLNNANMQIVQTMNVIFRAVRMIIDVKLHCGEMTFDEAIQFLEKETGMEHSVAVAEVKRYTKTPGYPLSYLLGKHLMMQLQREVKEHLEDKYSDREFHDVVLQAGILPFAHLREVLKLQGML